MLFAISDTNFADKMLTFFRDITFANPEFFWLMLVIPLLALWYILKKQNAEIRMSSLKSFEGIKPSFKVRMRHTLFVLRIIAIALLITALARPQSKSDFRDVKTEGIDLLIAMDISASMLAQDFKPNRIEVAKETAIEFIDNRVNDRLGLIIFSGEAFTQCPLTTDHAIIKNMFKDIKTGMVKDGTAIGMGLATAVNRIKDSKAKSKVIILLTDGVNNSGSIAPLTAAEIAKLYGIRVYTIGIGTIGKALSPIAMYPNGQYEYGYVDVDLDEKMMRGIAEMTGGKYFRATDNMKLKNIYKEIDNLEKTVIQEKTYTNRAERFLPFALLAGILLSLEIILKYTIFRSIP